MPANRKYKLYPLYLILAFSLITVIFVVVNRFYFETHNRDVELVMSYRELERLAQVGGLERDTLLEVLRRDTQITSIVLEEDTLEDYVHSGRVTMLKGYEIMNMYRVGHINNFLLTHLYGQTDVKPYRTYLMVEERADFDQIYAFLSAEFGADKVQKIGCWNILEVIDEEADLLGLGLGISAEKASRLRNLGFSLILRYRNSPRLTDAIIRHKLHDMATIQGAHTLIFEGASVLGYPAQMPLVTRKIFANDYQIGMIEFMDQLGMPQLAAQYPRQVLRVFSVNESDMATITLPRAVNKYVRAARERGAKILFLHSMMKLDHGEDVIDYNIRYIDQVSKRLMKSGYHIRPIQSLTKLNRITIRKWELLILSLGVLSILMLVLKRFYRVPNTWLAGSFLAFIVSYYLFYLLGLMAFWRTCIAVCAAVVFPSAAVVFNFPTEREMRLVTHRFSNGIMYLLKITGMSLAGALFVVSIMASPIYVLGIDQFFGVKLSFILPLLLIGLFFYLRPHRISSIFYVFRRLFYAPIRTASLLAGLFCLAFVIVYLLRSGNYLVMHVPVLESDMREFLENLFFIRPRTKEILIGYPFLFMAYYYADRGISRKWLWFFQVIGSVALISLINSFCHFHTPLLVSFYRSVLGLLLGIGVGYLYIVGFKLCQNMIKKMT